MAWNRRTDGRYRTWRLLCYGRAVRQPAELPSFQLTHRRWLSLHSRLTSPGSVYGNCINRRLDSFFVALKRLENCAMRRHVVIVGLIVQIANFQLTTRCLTHSYYQPTSSNACVKAVISCIFHVHRCCSFFKVFTCVSYAEARLSYRLSVCLSVCPSHAGIVSKRLNLSSNCLHYLVAQWF